ncbi:serum paraoxonase/arylesterase 2-like [Gouania willdenowi]|uniref:Paraoxonase n=1 Tax=Gouania willdenowi TaxID=441366 RepID=A0A8C5DF87_GOUWI|nr:serum paraoxonase/arylesterase 2-like [Gouania willdenowi]
MGKLVLTLAVAALSMLLGQRIVNLRERLQSSREVENKHLPNCVSLKDVENGSEDITILDDGVVFISSALNFPGFPSTGEPGRILFLDLQKPNIKPVELQIKGDFDLDSFNPHGISAYIDPKDGAAYLFVVNHPQLSSQVELFRYVENSLQLVHLKTISHELLHSVNDIVAVSLESFYATNDHYFSNQVLKTYVEPILCQPWTNVVYYGPEEVKVVSDGYYYANGINISPDERYIYVSDLLGHRVHMLERKQNNALVPVKSVAVGSLCDNIEVESETGDLWLGCHPNGWKLFMFNPDDPPASEVIRIKNIESDQPVVTQEFADNGQKVVGSSVAAPYGKKLFIGTVFDKTFYCDLK